MAAPFAYKVMFVFVPIIKLLLRYIRHQIKVFWLDISVFIIFRSLDSEQLIEVLDAMFERKAEPGETIITQVFYRVSTLEIIITQLFYRVSTLETIIT